MPAEDRPTSYRIGDLTLDLGRRNIRRRGELLPCGKLTFDLLVLLAERAPEVVDRAEIVERLWAGRYATPATVKQRVSLLRQALGERADNPRYIKVVRGQGYTLIPNVRASHSKPSSMSWKPLGLTATVAAIAFLVGLEIGYKEGLRPRIPDLAESASVLVTSWPISSGDAAEFGHELPHEDYVFVMGVAEHILTVLENADFVSKLNTAYALDGDVHPEESLSVIANASIRDHETLSINLTLLNKSLSDNRLARIYAMESWSHALEKVADEKSESIGRAPFLGAETRNRLAPFLGADIRQALARDDNIRILLPGRSADRSFMLVADFDFNRSEIQARPGSIQADAARSLAMAIDEQVPAIEFFGAR